MAITQVSNSLVKQDLTISGGTVDNTVIGSGTPAAGTFTTVAGTLASTVTGTTAAASDNSTKIATTAYVTTALANLVDSAPGTLNTLNELAAALGDDASFSTTVTTSIAAKLPLAGGTMTGDLILGDNVKIEVGSASGGDLEIYHDGSNSYINEQGTGALFIRSSYVAIAGANANQMLNAEQGAAIELYYNNAKKLETTSTGIDVTGSVTADDLIKVQNGAGSAAAEVDIVSGGTWRLRSNPTTGTNSYGFDIVKGSAGSDVKMSIDSSGTATFSGAVTIDPADGVADDAYALTVRNNEATDGRNYGLWVRAGSNSSDESFSVRNHDNSATYFKVRGDGNVGIGTTNLVSQFAVGGNGRRIEIQGGDGVIRGFDRTASWANIDFEAAGYTFDVSGSLALTIDSSGRVGVGGTPNANWRNDSTDDVLMLGTEATLHSDAGVTTELWNNAYVNNSDTFKNISARGASRYMQYSGAHKWFTAASASAGSTISTEINSSPKMVLDVSGNFFVGKSALEYENTTGHIFRNDGLQSSIRSGGNVADFNRLSSDGEIIRLSKDGTTVGSIGVANGDLNIDGDTGIRFQSSSLMPRSGGSDVDATVDLGLSSHRFKDAYLKGLNVTASTNNKIVSYFSGSYTSGFKFSDLNGGIWYDAGTDDLTVSAGHANSQLILVSGGSEAARFDSDGVAHFSGDVKVLSGDIQMGSGRGINFTANSNASGMSSETLDDYEEGTFTPTLGGGSTAGSFTAGSGTAGRYVKVGKMCMATISLRNCTLSGAAGGLQIYGLPFNAYDNALYSTSGTIMMHSFNFNTDRVQSLYMVDNKLYGIESVNGTSWQDWAITNSSSLYLHVTVCFEVDE